MWSIWRRGFGRAWCFGVDRNPSRARPAVRAPSVSGLDPKAMDRCDCDGAGEVDDSRGPSHLVEEMTLDANKHRTSSSRQGQDCLHCSPFARGNLIFQTPITWAVFVPATAASQWMVPLQRRVS